jgi:hypothetical protein
MSNIERNEFGDEFVVGCYSCGEDVYEVEESGFCKTCNEIINNK